MTEAQLLQAILDQLVYACQLLAGVVAGAAVLVFVNAVKAGAQR